MKYHIEQISDNRKHFFNQLVNKYNLNALTAKHIALNNKLDASNIERFLFPTIDKMDDPFKIKNMKEAIDLIKTEIEKNNMKYVAIVGDYDADGITATSIMKWFFRLKYGIELYCYVPERMEGYGLSKNIIDNVLKEGKNIIITVDNGIAAFEAIEYANLKNVKVIITDHHQIQNNEIPNAHLILNTVQTDCNYRDKSICGAGMAWNICRCLDSDIAYTLLPIVAIGTIADVVPLLNENRIYVAEGMKIYPKDEFIGLRKFYSHKKVDLDNFIATDVSFGIAPIINSAGREGHANLAFNILVEQDSLKIEKMFDELLELDVQRKEEQKRITEDVFNNLVVKDGQASITIKPKDYIYNPYIVGIVASKVTEKYNLPTVIFSENEKIREGKKTKLYTGSARGVEWFNFMKLVDRLKKENLLISGGGHKMAAGFSIELKDFDKFSEIFEEIAKETYIHTDSIPVLTKITLPKNKSDSKKILEKLYDSFKIIEPLGACNSRPFIAFDIGKPKALDLFGKELSHFKFKTESDISCVGWNYINSDGEFPNLKNKHFIMDVQKELFVKNNTSIEFFKLYLRNLVDI